MEFRPRRPHLKSRNGCLNCKQRRIKCDEKRPFCAQCEDSLRKCSYATDQHSPGPSEIAGKPISSVPSPTSSLSAAFGGFAYGSRGASPTLSPPVRTVSEAGSDYVPANFTDAELFHHFLNHTCKYTPRWHYDRAVLQVGIAKLALDSEPVSHSILAQAAACLCWDMICEGNANPAAIRQLLDIGLEHHTLALGQMHTMASCLSQEDIAPLVANGTMLVPFAFAFQRINHWVQLSDGSPTSSIISPADAILLMRGIRATLIALNSKKADRPKTPQKTTPWETIFATQATHPTDLVLCTGRSHSMFPILSSTFAGALSQLRDRIETVLATFHDTEAVGCVIGAYDLLNNIVSSTFRDYSQEAAKRPTQFIIDPDSTLAQIPNWLQRFILRAAHPSQPEPLVRSFLGFVSTASEAYTQLLLPLFTPQSECGFRYPQLTPAEVLALDVYVHWLVLMFLVEEEAWWVGDFPVVALQGLIARYGDELVNRSSNQEQWWPEHMLEIMMRFKQ